MKVCDQLVDVGLRKIGIEPPIRRDGVRVKVAVGTFFDTPRDVNVEAKASGHAKAPLSLAIDRRVKR